MFMFWDNFWANIASDTIMLLVGAVGGFGGYKVVKHRQNRMKKGAINEKQVKLLKAVKNRKLNFKKI